MWPISPAIESAPIVTPRRVVATIGIHESDSYSRQQSAVSGQLGETAKWTFRRPGYRCRAGAVAAAVALIRRSAKRQRLVTAISSPHRARYNRKLELPAPS